MADLKEKPPVQPPASTGDFSFNTLCAVFFLAMALLLKTRFDFLADAAVVGISLLATVFCLWVDDLYYKRVHLLPSSGLSTRPGAFDPQRLVVKLIGLFATWTIVALLYRTLNFYHESSRAIKFYGYFFDLLRIIAIPLICAAVVYFIYVDRRQKDPYDGFWHMGCLVTGRWEQMQWVYLLEYIKGWFIKAFFLPFMFGFLVEYVIAVIGFSWVPGVTYSMVYDHWLNIFYLLDVFYGFLGYFLTLRLTNTHIRSTEPTFLGWVVCLVCYYPFSAIIQLGPFNYETRLTWQYWFALNPAAFYLCGGLIILSSAIYGLASVAFGYRISNLAYGGIITGGPYRYTKHPAYLCKVASWWLIFLPFLSVAGPLVALKQTIGLSFISYIYYLRAKIEENHLANYPEYVAYAQWIDDHGIFRSFKKMFPALRFSEDKARRWNSVVWFKKLPPRES